MRRPRHAGSQVTVAVPVELHPASKALVQHFAAAIAEKLRDKFETWRIRRWIKRHTMTQDQLERALEERYGIPRENKVR